MKISTLIMVLLSGFTGCVLGFVFGKIMLPQYFWMSALWGIVIALFSAFIVILLSNRIRKEKKQKRIAKNSHVLPAQIDSVFLFNTLHNISALTSLSPEKASRTIEQLATFIRSISDLNGTKTTLLNEEIRIAELYLQIEQARFGERIRITKKIDATSLEVRVPCFMLLPLVENCVRHGIEVYDQNVEIFISTNRKDDGVVVEIGDTGEGIENEDVSMLSKGDMGLNCVKNSIKGFFGKKAQLTVEGLVPSGTRISLFLPLDEYN